MVLNWLLFELRIMKPHISDSSMRPLREAYQLSAETAVGMDVVLANAKALNQAASIVSATSASCRSAMQQESTHISHRLTARESAEPFQEKDMSNFLALQDEEKTKIDADFEKRCAELEAQYAV